MKKKLKEERVCFRKKKKVKRKRIYIYIIEGKRKSRLGLGFGREVKGQLIIGSKKGPQMVIWDLMGPTTTPFVLSLTVAASFYINTLFKEKNICKRLNKVLKYSFSSSFEFDIYIYIYVHTFLAPEDI